MEKEKFSYPVSLRRMQITDKFWKNEMELVRTEVIVRETIGDPLSVECVE